MTPQRTHDYLAGIVQELRKLPAETEWVEFKKNNASPEKTGEYISALANSAALEGKVAGYLVWGIRDDDHEVVGTDFDPSKAKKGNEPLENWLLRLLEPKIDFDFHEILLEEKRIVLLEITRATHKPVRFAGKEYIRVGSAKKALQDAPGKERQLWRIFDQKPFEQLVADEHLDGGAVLLKLDYPAYFDLLESPLPEERRGILEALEADDLIRPGAAGGWDITNLGAILFAKDLNRFPTLKRKAIRVVQYQGKGRTDAIKEQGGVKGYAAGFAGLIGFINDQLPTNELIGDALRRNVPMFPPLAVRELVANALIHQDFFITGTGPMIEVFEDRIEITNPGTPLIETQRFVDNPPRSRNETLASLMRRFGICEERGSGIDKVVSQVELFQLPAPLFESEEGYTRAILFAHKSTSDMDRMERVRACYLHACLKRVTRDYLTNSSLRKRFGIEHKNKATASRYIRETIEAGMIRPFDEKAAPKLMKYVPYWA